MCGCTPRVKNDEWQCGLDANANQRWYKSRISVSNASALPLPHALTCNNDTRERIVSCKVIYYFRTGAHFEWKIIASQKPNVFSTIPSRAPRHVLRPCTLSVLYMYECERVRITMSTARARDSALCRLNHPALFALAGTMLQMRRMAPTPPPPRSDLVVRARPSHLSAFDLFSPRV